jgi:hypothetical protein
MQLLLFEAGAGNEGGVLRCEGDVLATVSEQRVSKADVGVGRHREWVVRRSRQAGVETDKRGLKAQ